VLFKPAVVSPVALVSTMHLPLSRMKYINNVHLTSS
jgi:hypothetical protein